MRRWTIFTVLAVLVVLLAGWVLLVKPQKSKISTYQTQAQAQEQANSQLETQIEALQAEQKELPQQQLALAKFSTQIPNDEEEPTLIRQFSSAAHGAGVDLKTITPGAVTTVTASTSTGTQTLGGATTSAGSLSSLPISLAIVGSYPNVESFFESLEKLPRSLLVTGFTITPGGSASGATNGTNLLSVSISASVFFTPDATTTAPAGTAQTLPPATTPTTAASPAVSTPPAPATTS